MNRVTRERMGFIMLAALFLNANGCGGRRENDAVLLTLREWHFDRADVHPVVALRSEPLTIIEHLVLLLCRVASSFVITGIVGLARRGVALRLERLAQEHTAASGRSGDQRIAVAEFVADECTARCSDGVSDDARRTNARAARQHRADEK